MRTRSVGTVIGDAILPYTMARAVVPILKRAPAYERARAERRSRAWLDQESLTLGRELAEVVQRRLAEIG